MNDTDIDQPCFCVGPWLDDEPGETPDLLEREHPTGSTGCLYPKPVGRVHPDADAQPLRRLVDHDAPAGAGDDVETYR